MGEQPNEDLAALVAEAGYSNKELARDVRNEARARNSSVHCTHVDVRRWLDGTIPRGGKPALIAATLGRRLGRLVTPADIGMATADASAGLRLNFLDSASDAIHRIRALAEHDLDGSTRIEQSAVTTEALIAPMARWLVSPSPDPASTTTPPTAQIGARDVEAVRTTLRMFEMLDHQYGGGHARLPAVQYLKTTIAPLLAGTYTTSVGKDLLTAAAQFTYKTGAMAYDIGMHNLARRYFVNSLNLTHLAGDRALGGKALALMSHQANFLGDYQQAVDLARAAKVGARGHTTPTVHAMYCAMEARALASLGDQRACTHALKEAEYAFERGQIVQDPEWIGYFDRAELYDEFGHCFAAVRQIEHATKYGELALEHSAEPYRRSRTFCRLTLAQVQVVAANPRDRDVEKACHLVTEGLPELSILKSERVHAYLTRFLHLLQPYAEVPKVKEFHERLSAHQLGELPQ